MRHAVFGRKLSRTKNERRRLLQILSRDLILRGKITTSLAKAKAVQPLVEQLVTKAKKGTDAHRRQMMAILADRALVAQLMADAKTRFANRQSGFTRIIKMGPRRGDATEQAQLSFVDERVVVEVVKPKATVSAKIEAKKEIKPKKIAVKKQTKAKKAGK